MSQKGSLTSQKRVLVVALSVAFSVVVLHVQLIRCLSDSLVPKVANAEPPPVNGRGGERELPRTDELQEWTNLLSLLGNRYKARLIAFLPSYKVNLDEVSANVFTPEDTFKRIAQAADAVCVHYPKNLWLIKALYGRDKPIRLLREKVKSSAEYPLISFVAALPKEVAIESSPARHVDAARLSQEVVSAFINAQPPFIPKDLIAPKPPKGLFMSLTPGLCVSVDYRKQMVTGIELWWHTHYNSKSQFYAKQLKLRTFAEIDDRYARKIPDRSAMDVLPDEATLRISSSLMSIGELGALLQKSTGKTVTVDRCVQEQHLVFITPGLYSLSELIPAITEAAEIEFRVVGHVVHIADDSMGYESRAFYAEHDRRELEWWDRIAYLFESDEMRKVAQPFTAEDFLNFRCLKYATLTSNQRQFIDWLIDWVGEHPSPRQREQCTIRLTPHIDILWRGDCSQCNRGTGTGGWLWTYPEPR